MQLPEALRIVKHLLTALDDYKGRSLWEPPADLRTGRGHAPPPRRVEPWEERERARPSRSSRRERRDGERLIPIGFDVTQVPAGGEVDIEAKPQTAFAGERLAIPSDIAKHFDVVDVKVGKDSQMATYGRIAGVAFDMLAVGSSMEIDPCIPGMVITLRVANRDTKPRDFRAVMYGSIQS